MILVKSGVATTLCHVVVVRELVAVQVFPEFLEMYIGPFVGAASIFVKSGDVQKELKLDVGEESCAVLVIPELSVT